MSYVFVLNTDKQPLNPVHPARARYLLTTGQAAVYRRYPFTLILQQPTSPRAVAPLRLKVDPGSKTTGLAILNDHTGAVIFAAELHHRGAAIKAALDHRRAVRHNRRSRQLRHRPPRFHNRRRPPGWLPPSLASRVAQVTTWVRRLGKVAPIAALSLEWVKFDLQKLQNPEIAGVEYQQGALLGYEIREYLLLKWAHHCAYCGATDRPLQIEHIVPQSRGGTNRVSNLTLACESCNQRKGNRTATEFGYPQIQAQAHQPLRDAAAVNTTRGAVYRALQETGLPIETGSGGLTKFNRTQRNLPKTHWLDAACVGLSTPARLGVAGVMPWAITATGHNSRQMCRTDKYGFPRLHKTRRAVHYGFRTGDIGRAKVPQGKQQGTHVGRIAVRSSGKFRVGRVDGIAYRYIKAVWRADGYAYQILRGGAAPAQV